MADQNNLEKPDLTSNYASEVLETLRGHVLRLWKGDYTGMGGLVNGMVRTATDAAAKTIRWYKRDGGADVELITAPGLSIGGNAATATTATTATNATNATTAAACSGNAATASAAQSGSALESAINARLPLAGGTMTGALNLRGSGSAADPSIRTNFGDYDRDTGFYSSADGVINTARNGAGYTNMDSGNFNTWAIPIPQHTSNDSGLGKVWWSWNDSSSAATSATVALPSGGTWLCLVTGGINDTNGYSKNVLFGNSSFPQFLVRSGGSSLSFGPSYTYVNKIVVSAIRLA